MSSIPPEQEAAAILTRILEALARQNGKTLSASTRADVVRACELLGQSAGSLEELLDDIPPRQSPGEQAIDDPKFQQWRAARAAER